MKHLLFCIIFLCTATISHAQTIDYNSALSKKIQESYISFFNRSADRGGMAYWTQQVNSGNIHPSNIAIAIGNTSHQEIQDNFSAIKHSPALILEKIYRNRTNQTISFITPNQSYTDIYGNNELWKALNMVKNPSLVQPQGNESIILANKIEVANYYTQHYVTYNSSSAIFRDSWSPYQTLLSRYAINLVNSSSSSVNLAKNYIDQLYEQYGYYEQ